MCHLRLQDFWQSYGRLLFEHLSPRPRRIQVLEISTHFCRKHHQLGTSDKDRNDRFDKIQECICRLWIQQSHWILSLKFKIQNVIQILQPVHSSSRESFSHAIKTLVNTLKCADKVCGKNSIVVTFCLLQCDNVLKVWEKYLKDIFYNLNCFSLVHLQCWRMSLVGKSCSLYKCQKLLSRVRYYPERIHLKE